MTTAEELFDLLPLESAMAELRVAQPNPLAVGIDLDAADPTTRALLLLYLDDLDQAHELVQKDSTLIGCWIHAIIHRREGDYFNSLYWYARCAQHPLLQTLPIAPQAFVDRLTEGEQSQELIDAQRAEWKAIYDFVEGHL